MENGLIPVYREHTLWMVFRRILTGAHPLGSAADLVFGVGVEVLVLLLVASGVGS